MKKVKIMLVAITTFAVVGGALAFKIKKQDIDFYCTNAANQACSISAPLQSTFTDPGKGVLSFCSTESHTGNDCPQVSLKVNE